MTNRTRKALDDQGWQLGTQTNSGCGLTLDAGAFGQSAVTALVRELWIIQQAARRVANYHALPHDDYERVDQAVGRVLVVLSALTGREVKRQALLEAIKANAKKGASTAGKEYELVELQQSRPETPQLPRVLLTDKTPEALAFSLATIWPSSAIVSSQGGIVTGGHAMGSDSIMPNLALLNVLWGVGEHSTGRRSKESFTVRNARLTVSLQIQPEALRRFFAKAGPLARDSGFMARFLLAWPASTQGTRLYREPPEHWLTLESFNQPIRVVSGFVCKSPLRTCGEGVVMA